MMVVMKVAHLVARKGSLMVVLMVEWKVVQLVGLKADWMVVLLAV